MEQAYQERYRELLETDRRVAELLRFREKFMEQCTHELRAPLQIIDGHVRMLEQGTLGPLAERQRASIKAIQHQWTRLIDLLENMLELRRLVIDTAEKPNKMKRENPPTLETRQQATRLLLVEDDLNSAQALEELLGDDYEVEVAHDGEQALELVRSHLPDVMLLDIHLPKLDGFAVLDLLQCDTLHREMPVILMSAQGDTTIRSQAVTMGALDFLVKPFQLSELKTRIEKAVRLKKQRTRYRTLSETDELTGLLSYGAFFMRLKEEFQRASRYDHPLAAIIVDLDDLSRINERYGRRGGDRAILELSQLLHFASRENDLVARFGGDKFAILLPHNSIEKSWKFATRVMQEIDELDRFGWELEIPLRITMGMAVHTNNKPFPGPKSLMDATISALYRAKAKLDTEAKIELFSQNPPLNAALDIQCA